MQKYEEKERRSGKRMGYICLILGIFLVLLAITLIILGYFVSFKGGSEIMRDGLGRMLDEVPSAMSIILPQWAGHVWFIVDCLILLTMIVLIDRLFVKSKVYFTGIKNVDF